VIVDEAYIDFASSESLLKELDQYPNLIVLQTFSKAWGCAAIRLGMAFASPEIIAVFNKIKYPYNVNRLTQEEAIKLLQHPETVKEWVNTLLEERARVMEAFVKLPCCIRVFPTDANFFLAKVYEATQIYDYLVSEGIIVRNRTNVMLCKDCLRITIGTKEENDALLEALGKVEIE
jgi:histidinol-phosphate aminotransferase